MAAETDLNYIPYFNFLITKKALLIFALGSMLAMPALAQNQGNEPRLNPGVGPAINVSQVQNFGDNTRVLPENAQTFINNYRNGVNGAKTVPVIYNSSK